LISVKHSFTKQAITKFDEKH